MPFVFIVLGAEVKYYEGSIYIYRLRKKWETRAKLLCEQSKINFCHRHYQVASWM